MRGSVLRAGVAATLLAGALACRRAPAPEPPPPHPPQTSGTIAVAGIRTPATVVRDRWGVPHITAQSADDLFFAQGFVQAQDRLFQMDLWRRSVQGRLSETLGANYIERDAMTRRMQFRGDINREWASYSSDTRDIAVAFTRGINAWVSIARADLPEEFVLAGWLPEYWKAEDLLNRTDAFVASGDAQTELLRARLAAAIGIDTVRRLLPAPDGGPLTVSPGVDFSAITYVVPETVRRAGTPPFFSALAAPVSTAPRPSRAAAPDVVNPVNTTREPPTVQSTGSGVTRVPAGASGSAWALGPSRTDTGGALLAVNAVHAWDAPSRRYLVHLTAPGWNVAGATAPWLPGVAIGHNDRIAWGMSAAPIDTQDIFVERINPDDPHQVEQNGRWVDLAVEYERLDVKGRETPFQYERLYTAHGVVVALDRQRHLAYSLRWTGAEPGGAGELAALAIGRAQTWTEFASAVSRWKMPAAEFVYADVEGHIGRVAAGLVPDRPPAAGAVPAAGWMGDVRSGAPSNGVAIDPPGGLLVSAASPSQRSHLAERIASARVQSTATTQRLQVDTTAWNATRLLPFVERASVADEPAAGARQRLLAWDRRVDAGSDAAALYVLFEDTLAHLLAAQRVPKEFVADVAARIDVVDIVARPTSDWFDGDPAPARDRLIAAALREAAAAGNAASPTIVFSHPLAAFDAGRRRFNVGPIPRHGYPATVFATTGRTGPTFRAVFDVAAWDRSIAVVAPGQSGSPASLHYDDMGPLWAAGDAAPLPFSREAVAADARETLVLTPR